MISTTSFMEDIEKFMVNLGNASLEELIISGIVVFLFLNTVRKKSNKDSRSGIPSIFKFFRF